GGGGGNQAAAPKQDASKQENQTQEKQKPETEKQANAAPVDAQKTNGQAQQQPQRDRAQALSQQREVPAGNNRQPEPAVAQQQSSDTRVKASPLAKKIARDNNIELAQLEGSGDTGRIVRRDVESFLQKGPSTTATQPTAPQRRMATSGSFEDVNLSQMRKTIARRLGESKFSAPHFYLTMEIRMDNAMQARKQILDTAGDKISVNDLVIKAAAVGLRRHPDVNCSWLGDKLRYYNYVNIGMAVAIEDGLVVPVIRDADFKTLSEISREAKSLAQRAKERKLQPQDWEGNTFSISNLGMMGIEEFTAIINPPDACIMAVGAVKETVVVEKGEMKVGNVMKVTMSCDHRAVDGAMGARFLQTFKQLLENPVLMLV
ncbi:MAG TPA: 2-oxo acid dehydrogenase subunit E2, partial [Chitinophagales bacterium]|nr:2-oxo acid dehydrogenase subunit E2 [Chitinophagales bacterium]